MVVSAFSAADGSPRERWSSSSVVPARSWDRLSRNATATRISVFVVMRSPAPLRFLLSTRARIDSCVIWSGQISSSLRSRRRYFGRPGTSAGAGAPGLLPTARPSAGLPPESGARRRQVPAGRSHSRTRGTKAWDPRACAGTARALLKPPRPSGASGSSSRPALPLPGRPTKAPGSRVLALVAPGSALLGSLPVLWLACGPPQRQLRPLRHVLRSHASSLLLRIAVLESSAERDHAFLFVLPWETNQRGKSCLRACLKTVARCRCD